MLDGGAARRRIAVWGDVLRPVDSEFRASQSGNIHWFHRLVQRPVARATGLPVEPVTWGDGTDTPGVYAAAGMDPGIEGWIRLFDAPDLPADAAHLLLDGVADCALVIGFELAEVQKTLLSWAGIPYIDFNIHPYRFGPDVFFAVDTNHAGVLERLRARHAEDWTFEPWADLLLAQAVKMPPPEPVEETCLIVGQTRVDRSLIAGGRLLDFSAFGPALRDAVGKDGSVLFRPHPYNPGSFGLHEAGLPHRRIRPTRVNVYVLLAQPALRQVVAVSSSVVAEAPFFGKQGVFLHASPFRIPPTRDAMGPRSHASLVEGFMEADFWRDLLAPLLPVTAADGRRVALPPNTLRTALRQFWGFNEVSTDFLVDIAQRR
ncbi:MAG TPA: hypothetical protein VE033_13930 [Acetobacteraceae bacterium]|nr:hypothetical protein [Acetobacteraceae bacterium]